MLLFLLFLALYVRTAAPSVLSGDSAEFQMAAPLLGVPHPTTYPLYVLLGKLATLVIPFGDLAWRVTIVSSVCAALAVGLFFGIARQLTASAPAALVGSLALGLAPGEGAYGQTDWRTPVAAHAADSGDNLLKVAFLVSCAWAEDHTGPYTGGYDGFAARYVETLAKLGYEPDPYETQQIAEARSRSEQPESDADDPTDDQHDNDEHADEPDETAPEADDSAA